MTRRSGEHGVDPLDRNAAIGSRAPDVTAWVSDRPEPDHVAAARAAETHLKTARPIRSAAHVPTRAQTLCAGALVLTLASLVALAPHAAVFLAQTLMAAGLIALVGFRIAAVATAPPRPAPPIPDAALPTVTVIAPLYREAAVAPGLAACLERLDYPTDKREIVFVVEADDAETLRVARLVARSSAVRVIVAPEGAPRTKPRALNIALALTHGDIVTVYDAEDRPHPDQLRAAASAFAAGGDRLACVQAPLGWWNTAETWITRQFTLEYAAQFHVILPALARWGWPLPLGGTSNHFRRTALEAVGGWDPHNVTEDADLGFRLAEDGWRTSVIAPPTLEEAPTRLAPWTRQRSRWIKGFIQTWLVRMRDPGALVRGAGWRGHAALHLTLALSVASSVAHAPLAVLAVLGAVTALTGAPAFGFGAREAVFLAIGYGASALTAYVGVRRAGVPGAAAHIALMPLYWPFHTVAAVKALWDLAVRPFHWEKTAHGCSRLAPPSHDGAVPPT